MATPYLSEIRIFSFSFPPRGWNACSGQILPISQNQALFSLLGTTYGGDGRTNFALPDLRGRVAMGPAASYPLGQAAGETSHTLSTQEMPAHLHIPNCNTAPGSVASPVGAFFAGESGGNLMYGAATPNTTLAAGAVNNAGTGQAHENRMPYLGLNFCIAVSGIFPARS
jgi:microcystin-dependent protein